jgi:Na+/phosphate symporter
MIFGVLISVVLIGLSLTYVNKLFANDTQEVLVKFILLVFTALVGVWVVDKVVAFKISLLSDSEDKELFDLIKTLILMIFSYYFGTKKQVEK